MGTNGCLQLGTLGDDGEIDYDLWDYLEEFFEDDDGEGDPEPMICPLGADLDLTTTGGRAFRTALGYPASRIATGGSMHLSAKLLTVASLLTDFPNAALAQFSDDFDDGNAASRWSVAFQEEAGDPVLGGDGVLDFAFDYSTLGVASAPGSAGTTIGAFIQVNTTDQTVGNEGETYIVYPDGVSVTAGNFAISADMYVWNDGGGGSTEHGMIGAFLDDMDPVAPYEFGSRGGPLAWVYSGEGGDSSGDLGAFAEGNASSTGYLALGDYDALPAAMIPGFETGVGGARGPAAVDSSGSWVEVRIFSDGSTIDWYVNGVLVDSYDNSGGFYTTGNVFLGASDAYNSSSAANGTIIDNVVVLTNVPVELLRFEIE